MSTWLYHFWLFSFKTAKHWGRGPQRWTADILGLDAFRPENPLVVSSPATSASQNTPRSIDMIDEVLGESTTTPSPLCRWSIHVSRVHYESIASSPRSPPANVDLDPEESWRTWPASSRDKDVTQKLTDGLQGSTFTNVRPNELPIATDKLVTAVKQSPQQIHQEALGFSIMSRSVGLMKDLIETMSLYDYKINGLYPFHLAVAYLDGSKVCCNLLDQLMMELPLRQYYVNDLGHTVLDQVMVSILKSHTSCKPNIVDSFFKNEKRFEGAEVDICGRWDADSPCVRDLLAKGDPTIPFGWKHMFCHTSVLTLCHAIGTLFGPNSSPDVNTLSGLFTRRCSHCGLKLQLRPLHALVMVGFHLSKSGCKGESLFGILACLLCLLSYGADPRLKADVSFQSLLGEQDSDRCSHKELDPKELIEGLLASSVSMWSEEITTAWDVVTYVLSQSRAEWNGESSSNAYAAPNQINHFVGNSGEKPDSDAKKSIIEALPAYCPYCDKFNTYFGRQKSLATLWAAVKTELLTFRRLTEDDAFLSRNFDMISLKQGLTRWGKVTVLLVDEAMMKPYCKCGNFSEKAVGCTIVDEACAFYFSNMEDRNRTTFIGSPEDRKYWWNH